MLNLESLLYLSIIVVYLLMIVIDLRRDLHIMQLNSYRVERYMRWAKAKYFVGIKAAVVFLVVPLVCLLFDIVVVAGIMLIIFWLFYSYKVSTQKSKKPLAFTKRAIRIFSTSILILLAYTAAIVFCVENTIVKFVMLIMSQILSGVFVCLAVFVLSPVEKIITKSFYNDAKRMLESHSNLTIIGITGSYGKTSTKHFLHDILSEKYHVLMTPGSFNTTLGVIRTIREQLKPVHQIFIAEMGAKQKGDIQEICQLVKPQIGILTAVAPMHIETFRTIENIRDTKFELINSLPVGGLGVMNADYRIIKDTKCNENISKVFYSIKYPNADYSTSDIKYTGVGMEFKICEKGKEILSLETKLLGDHNVSNIMAACVVALHLGVEKDSIRFAVKKLKPVEHRLEIKPNPQGITVIDDAYNSNPNGAKMALDVLKQIAGNKKIIITPGMVELGDKEAELNHTFGEQIADTCDIVILVGRKQTKPIFAGLVSKAFPDEKIYVAESIFDANRYMRSIVVKGDVVLYENDLPDTFDE